MGKMAYESPLSDVTRFETEDVITTSAPMPELGADDTDWVTGQNIFG